MKIHASTNVYEFWESGSTELRLWYFASMAKTSRPRNASSTVKGFVWAGILRAAGRVKNRLAYGGSFWMNYDTWKMTNMEKWKAYDITWIHNQSLLWPFRLNGLTHQPSCSLTDQWTSRSVVLLGRGLLARKLVSQGHPSHEDGKQKEKFFCQRVNPIGGLAFGIKNQDSHLRSAGSVHFSSEQSFESF